MASTPSVPLPLRVADPKDPALNLRVGMFYDPAPEGGLRLRLEAHPDSLKLAEFRENNRALNAQLKQVTEELAAKVKLYEGIDPAEHRALAGRLKTVEAAAATANQSKARAAEVEAALQSERAAHARTRLAHLVSSEFLAWGGRKEAADYIVEKASKVFSVTPGGDVTSEQFSPDDPSSRLTISEWLNGQVRESAFAFAPSRGGGATHSQAGPAARAPRVISSDPLEFGKNLESIAKGETVVVR